MSDVPASRARAARLAVGMLFFANGAASASILPRLPAIKDGLGLSNAELGIAVGAMPLGGLIAGGFVGILIARFGSNRVAAISGVLTVLMVAALGLAPSFAALAGAYFVMGMFDATMDASQNVHGVGVERVYRRSILQGFHGGWSLGGLVAGIVGALAAGAGVPVSVHLSVVAVVLAIALVATARGLLPASVADAHDAATDEPVIRIHARNAPHLLRLLVPIAMLGILCAITQTSAATFGAVFGTDVLKLDAGFAALGFVLYTAGMTVSRMTNDRWVDALGTTRLVRIGSLLAFVAVLAVIASAPLQSPVLAYGGFLLIGIGTSSMFPIMVATAGSRPGLPPGYGVALVSWLVRIGLMFAPAIIGVAADAVGLAAALWISALTAVAIWLFAPAMTGATASRTQTGPATA